MHMADALVSPAVGITASAIATSLIVIASRKLRDDNREGLTSMMGVMGAFVFAAQMINFTIPGTGSSGHIIGGVLLSAILGPWAAFITLCSVLVVQCLVFADGGLLSLGCNIINMAAMSCLVAYPLIFKPIMNFGKVSTARLMTAAVLASIVGLELGALLVSIETTCSGISALPFVSFVSVMLPIHLVIGACEGIATGLVLVFVFRNSPSMLMLPTKADEATSKHRRNITLGIIGAVTVVLAIAFTFIASEYPDGLEWSISKIYGSTELAAPTAPITAFMPDYQSYFAGIIGTMIVLVMLWAFSTMLFRKRRNVVKHQQ